MTRHLIVLAILSATALGEAAAAQDSQADASSLRTRYGMRRIDVTVQLARPEFYAAREITREVQTQEWDCEGRRYRIRERIFQTSDGLFVRSERETGAWTPAPKEGAGARTFATACPGEAAAER